MLDNKQKMNQKSVDTQEFELPETTYIRDIENKVFQSIVLQCLSQIQGINLVEGSFIDHLLGRGTDRVKGIVAEQDEKKQCVNIKIEVNILYGVVIPDKAEEIQNKIAEEITRITGLHVSTVHVIFKNVISQEFAERLSTLNPQQKTSSLGGTNYSEEYTDEF